MVMKIVCDECGMRLLSVLPLLCFAPFNRTALLHSHFYSSPCPLSPVLSCLLALNNPPPPGVGGAGGSGDLRRRACGLLACVLISSCRSLACARSLLSRLRFGFSSRASFFPAYRVGSRWSSSGPVLVSPRVSRPVRFLLCACFPPLSHPSGSVGSSPLLSRSRLGDSVAVPCHPIGAVCLLRPSRSRAASCRSCPRAALVLSCLVPPFAPPCLS